MCIRDSDDGLDTDPDGDGIYQSVWDKGVLGQALLFPEYYDVDNDNDGVPDGKIQTMTTTESRMQPRNFSLDASQVRNRALGTTTMTG